MNSRILTLVSAIFLFCCLASAQDSALSNARKFGIEGDHFVLDGKPFQIISGEMHYCLLYTSDAADE